MALNFKVQTYQQDNASKYLGVGLQFKQTGVPLFLFYLREIQNHQYRLLTGIHKFEHFMSSLSHKEDIQDLSLLRAFFESGGQKAFLVISPLIKGEMNLESFIGSNLGYDQMSGLSLLKRHSHHGDILSIPQASQYLKKDELKFFSQKVLDEVEKTDHLFALLDCPFGASQEDIKDLGSKLVGSDGALFHPWLTKGECLTPASIVMAALYQNNDNINNLSDSIANRPFDVPFLPVKLINQNEAKDLLDHHVNVITLVKKGDIRIFRGVTLSKSSESLLKYISLRRVSKSLEFSLGMICEKYVLEPLNQNTRVLVQNELEDFCKGLKNFFDPFADKPFQIKTKIGEASKDNTLIVDAHFKLPNALEDLSVGIKMAN